MVLSIEKCSSKRLFVRKFSGASWKRSKKKVLPHLVVFGFRSEKKPHVKPSQVGEEWF